jgi:hypothetical protein
MPAKKKPVAKKPPSKTKLVFGPNGGVKLTLDKRILVVETPGGRTITLNDQTASVEIDDGNGNIIKLAPAGITIQAASKVRIDASEIQLNAGTTKFSGTVQCDALVSNSVISASYSPGVGNIW